jgi:hypothetical protein
VVGIRAVEGGCKPISSLCDIEYGCRSKKQMDHLLSIVFEKFENSESGDEEGISISKEEEIYRNGQY